MLDPKERDHVEGNFGHYASFLLFTPNSTPPSNLLVPTTAHEQAGGAQRNLGNFSGVEKLENLLER
jgi:hypothetical protein